MDHVEATRRMAAEQYLLDEMSAAEREEFEEHFFACDECADAVETGTVLVTNARAIFQETPERRRLVAEKKPWFGWLWQGWSLAPGLAMAGCALLAVLVGYQNFVQIPGLRRQAESGEFAMMAAIPVRAARSAQELTLSKHTGLLTLRAVHEWEDSYPRYEATIERASGEVLLKTESPATQEDLTISLRPERLQAGQYTLVIYGLTEGSEKKVVQRVPFQLTE
jgi:hypothetical protein